MHDIESIKRAFTKNPSAWAEMYLENRQLLDTALTEIASLRDTKRPAGQFDSQRCESFITLLNCLTLQATVSYLTEKEAQGSNQVVSLGARACTVSDLERLHEHTTRAQRLVADYLKLRKEDPDAKVSRLLRCNNPLEIMPGSHAHLADEFGVVHYMTPVDGLIATMWAIGSVRQDFKGAVTYKEFFTRWFKECENPDQKIARACKLIKSPDTLIVNSADAMVVLAQTMVNASFTSKLDKAFIEKHYPLEAYVTALDNL